MFINILLSILVCIFFTTNLRYILPNLLLFTSYKDQTNFLWNKLIYIDKNKEYELKLIKIIDKEEYSFNKLKVLTNYWTSPCVVRNLFSNSIAVKKWMDKDYLPTFLGKIKINTLENASYGNIQNIFYNDLFNKTFNDIILNTSSTKYLFFPTKTRINNYENGSYEEMTKIVNKLVLNDLNIDKIIWNGFGTNKHKKYIGSQLIIGRGQNNNTNTNTTGTGWHCAIGNNWFIQVVGHKRWYFLNPKYSYYLGPLRYAASVFILGNQEAKKLYKYLPIEYVDLYPGDLLYNPDWYWHTIYNDDGLTIGVPLREFNITLSFKNNYHFTFIAIINNILKNRFNYDIDGYKEIIFKN